MSALNLPDRRIEKYLTNFSVAYKQGLYAADFVSPPFKVAKSSDKYLTYTKQDFRVINDKVVGREKAKEISLKSDESSYACEEYSQSDFISDRDLQNMDGVGTIRLKEDTIKHLKDSHMLSRENRVMAIAGSSSVVTQTSDLSAGWATSSSGTPVKNINTAQSTIESAIGIAPNRIILPFDVAMSMTQCDEWKDNFKYTSSSIQSLSQAVDALRNIGLEPLITGARGLSTYEGGASDPTWERLFNDKCLIFYAESNPTPRSMSFMYSPYTPGNFNKIESYRVNGERGTTYDIYTEIDELLVNASAAYLYTNLI